MPRIPRHVAAERPAKHPATFSASILAKLSELVPDGLYLDPFAGVGKIHQLTTSERCFVGVELEPEWAQQDARTMTGDSLVQMREWVEDGTRFDGVVTSPVYGNRMSDHHNAQDGARRRSYTHDLGHALTEGNSGTMYFWQDEYKMFHRKAWGLAHQVTRESGQMFLNVSDFIRDFNVMHVVQWHMIALQSTGWRIVKVHRVETPRNRDGENAELRAEYEAIIQARKP